MIDNNRKCKKCKEIFKLNDDNFYRSSFGTFLSKCKNCYKEDQAQQRKKRYYSDVEAGRERENERYHRYKKKSERRIKWTEERKESGKTLEWQRENKDRGKVYSEKRIHKDHDITKNEWKSCKEYFCYKCAYCNLPIEEHFVSYKGKIINGDFHKEHVDYEGSIYLDNCVPACRNCNSEKHTFKLKDWYNDKNPKFSLERLNKIYKWIYEDYELHMEYKYNIEFSSDFSITNLLGKEDNMNLIMYVNDHFEEEKALFDLDENRTLLKGDCYHDKIDERIEGYLKALDEFKIYSKDVPTEWIDSTHQHYELLEFYEE